MPPELFRSSLEVLDRLRPTLDKSVMHLRASSDVGQEFILLGSLFPAVQKVREVPARPRLPNNPRRQR